MRIAPLLLIGVGAVAASGCPNSLAPHQVGVGGGGGGRFLTFFVEPTTAHAGAFITPAVQVAVEDSTGAVDSTYQGGVTLALSTNPGNATLSGTTTVVFVSGVASFSDLTVNVAATGYVMSAASSGLTTITSTTFDIIP